MDGNGRWAKARWLPRVAGHRAGVAVLTPLLETAGELGVEALTLYAFSTENWERPEAEVDSLMALFLEAAKDKVPELNERGAQLRFLGRRGHLPEDVQAAIEEAEGLTRDNDRLQVYVALNYGGRAEIVDAARTFSGETEEDFRRHLYAPDMHDPDLLIRTSGEQRISNYLLWQCAYSELVFRDELWPDFDRAALEACLREYETRQRRFGSRA
jgi:undecaprenyl diphosphate synthase